MWNWVGVQNGWPLGSLSKWLPSNRQLIQSVLERILLTEWTAPNSAVCLMGYRAVQWCKIIECEIHLSLYEGWLLHSLSRRLCSTAINFSLYRGSSAYVEDTVLGGAVHSYMIYIMLWCYTVVQQDESGILSSSRWRIAPWPWHFVRMAAFQQTSTSVCLGESASCRA